MMNRYLAFVLFLLTGIAVHGQPSRHVILISIDGLHPDMYLDPSWPTPNLRHLMRIGTYAERLRSVFPAYTYPSHTAMLTGALPARSGIYFNQPKGSKGEWNWDARYIRVPTLWQALHKAGLSTAAVQWPVSMGAEIDYTIPEIWSVDHPDDRITESRKYATPGLIGEIERNATGRLDSTNMNDNYFSLDDNASRMAAYIFSTYRPAFLALHFAAVDGTEHTFGRDGDSVRLAVAANDRAIGNILEAIEKSGAKDSTTIIVLGDHGFCSIHDIFRPNILIRDLPVRFIASGGSAFLYATKNFDERNGNSIKTAVIKKLDSLPENKRRLFRILDRAELDKMGADSSALFALSASPGLVFSGSMAGSDIFLTTKGGHHGYDPDLPEMYTGFVAAGAGVRQGGKTTELSETDIAPLIAALLGISFPCPDGHPPLEILSSTN